MTTVNILAFSPYANIFILETIGIIVNIYFCISSPLT